MGTQGGRQGKGRGGNNRDAIGALPDLTRYGMHGGFWENTGACSGLEHEVERDQLIWRSLTVHPSSFRDGIARCNLITWDHHRRRDPKD